MKKKPDAAARLAAKVMRNNIDLLNGLAKSCERVTSGNVAHKVAGIKAGIEAMARHLGDASTGNRIRSLIRREVKAERERMIALAEDQRHYELVHHLTRAGAFALDDLLDKMKGPK